MLDLIPGLVTGVVAGAIIGWVLGHHWATQHKIVVDPTLNPTDPIADQERIEDATRKIRSLTLSVAADVSAHQSIMADITTGLEDSGAGLQADAIMATVSELVAANQQMQAKLAETQNQLREQSRQLRTTEQLAYTDQLTGLSNRRYLDAELDRISNLNGPERGTVAIIDVDHFKSVNDVYGHPTGDLVLTRVAELIEARLGGDAICARFGGEEFAILSKSGDAEKVAASLEQLRVQLASLRIVPSDLNRQITFSCGVATHVDDELNASWISRADAALYAAKGNGRNNIHIANKKVHHRYSPVPGPTPNASKQNGAGHAVSATGSQLSSSSNEVQEIDAAKNRKCLISQLRTMATNIDLDHVSIAAVAIRLPDVDLTPEQRETALERTRGMLRAVDKCDFDDASTLLVLMVTSDMKKTEERASQLLDSINQTIQELENVDLSSAATLGISVLSDDLSADDVIRLAVERASSDTGVAS